MTDDKTAACCAHSRVDIEGNCPDCKYTVVDPALRRVMRLIALDTLTRQETVTIKNACPSCGSIWCSMVRDGRSYCAHCGLDYANPSVPTRGGVHDGGRSDDNARSTLGPPMSQTPGQTEPGSSEVRRYVGHLITDLRLYVLASDYDRVVAERDDARNLVVEVALGITHSTACDPGNGTPCVRCQRDRLRETNTKLNRRCSQLEAAVKEKIREHGPSIGRALSLAGYRAMDAERDRLREVVEAAKRMRGDLTCDARPLDEQRIDVPECDCCDPCNAARQFDAALAEWEKETTSSGSTATMGGASWSAT